MKDGHPREAPSKVWHCRGPMSRAESRAAGWVARWLEANCIRVEEYGAATADQPAGETLEQEPTDQERSATATRFTNRAASGPVQDHSATGHGGGRRPMGSEYPGSGGEAEPGDVVRTRRLEVLDEDGRVRIAIGMLGVGEGPMFGLKVLDETGRDRIWALHDGPLAEVALDFGGNTAAALTVDDWGEASLFLGEEG